MNVTVTFLRSVSKLEKDETSVPSGILFVNMLFALNVLTTLFILFSKVLKSGTVTEV